MPSIQLQGGISGIRASYEVQVDRLQQNSILQFEIRNRSNLITAFTFEDIWLPINTKWFCVLFNNFNLDLTPEQIGAPYYE